MKVILPMAGRGSRFANEGFRIPKPLIEIKGKPMFAWALKSLEKIAFDELIFIALKEFEEQFSLSSIIEKHCTFPYKIVWLDEVTDGQLCTVITADTWIQDDDDILIVPSDTWVRSPIGEDIQSRTNGCKGIISVINVPGEQWSFAKTEVGSEQVIKVAEKKRISDWASTGLYYFSHWKSLMEIAQDMIQHHETTKGEYYIIPAYQKLIDQGEQVIISKAESMWDMGTPDSKEKFEQYLDSFK